MGGQLGVAAVVGAVLGAIDGLGGYGAFSRARRRATQSLSAAVRRSSLKARSGEYQSVASKLRWRSWDLKMRPWRANTALRYKRAVLVCKPAMRSAAQSKGRD